MIYYAAKVLISALLIVAVSELAKRDGTLAGLLASLPLVGVLSMIWLFVETSDVQKISELSTSIFWLVLPSLLLFIALPILLKQGVHFYLSLLISIALTILGYLGMLWLMKKFGLEGLT
jgi:hypothetical protein